jgi:hypothetical protein
MDPSTSADLCTCYGSTSAQSSILSSTQTLSPLPCTSNPVIPTQYTLFLADSFSSHSYQTLPACSLKILPRATIFELDLVSFSAHCTLTPSSPSVFSTKYKKVKKCTFPVLTTKPEEFHIERRHPPDPLGGRLLIQLGLCCQKRYALRTGSCLRTRMHWPGTNMRRAASAPSGSIQFSYLHSQTGR